MFILATSSESSNMFDQQGSSNYFSVLAPFYRSFSNFAPHWLSLPTLKSILYSTLIIGLFCVISLLLADFLLMGYYNYNRS